MLKLSDGQKCHSHLKMLGTAQELQIASQVSFSRKITSQVNLNE